MTPIAGIKNMMLTANPEKENQGSRSVVNSIIVLMTRLAISSNRPDEVATFFIFMSLLAKAPGFKISCIRADNVT